jgi:hypothetical protein
MPDYLRAVTVNLRPAEFEGVAPLARRRGVSPSDVVRHALGFVPEATATARDQSTAIDRDKSHLQLVGSHQ